MIGLLLLLSILLLPIIGVPMTLISATKVNTYKYSRVLILAFYFGLIGFFFVPTEGTDLSRYFENYVDVLHGMSFTSVMQSMHGSDFFFIVQKMLFFFVSRFQSDQLLPAITLFIVYFVAFTIIVKYAKKNNYTRAQTLTSFLFMLSVVPLASLANNVRNITAVALFCLGLYFELEDGKKKRAYLLYVLSMSMHMGVIPLVLLKIVINLIMNIKKRKLFFNLVAFSLLIVISVILVQIGVMDDVLEKGSTYISGGVSGTDLQQWFAVADKSAIEKVSKFMSALVSVMIIFLSIKELVLDKKSNKLEHKVFMNKELVMNVMLISMISLFLFFKSGTTWFRFYFIELFYVAIYFRYSMKQNNKTIKSIILLFWIIVVIWNIILQIHKLSTQANMGMLIKNINLIPIYQLLK